MMSTLQTPVGLRINNSALHDTLAGILDSAGYVVVEPEELGGKMIVLTTDVDAGLNACASLVERGASVVVFMSRTSPAVRKAYAAAGAIPIEIGAPAREILAAIEDLLVPNGRSPGNRINGHKTVA